MVVFMLSACIRLSRVLRCCTDAGERAKVAGPPERTEFRREARALLHR